MRDIKHNMRKKLGKLMKINIRRLKGMRKKSQDMEYEDISEERQRELIWGLEEINNILIIYIYIYQLDIYMKGKISNK